uniref:Hexosyltransferase n=1 Tax=Cacopsylla melanoneura TaxID=428564 RepID=A0A8D9ED28_9HEMI
MSRRRKLLLLVTAFICTCYLVMSHSGHSADIAFVLSNSVTRENFNSTSAFSIDSLPLNDSSQLINITNFKFLINPTCSQSPYIVVVSSAPGNYHKRHLIRSTWGLGVPLYFFFGETANNQTLLDTESAEYHDVVQGSFIDSYRNLTYKHTMVFKWVLYNCPRVRYVLKIDDDVFINVAKLDEFLTQTLSPYGTRNLLMCTEVFVDQLAIRTYRSKWRVSFAEYPHRLYPPYCIGASLLYSPDIMFKLYQSLQQDGKYFWVDDVFITGIVFSNLNLTHSEFNWWTGKQKSLIQVLSKEDLLKFNPHRDLLALILEPNYVKKFEYLYNVTYLQSGLNQSTLEIPIF